MLNDSFLNSPYPERFIPRNQTGISQIQNSVVSTTVLEPFLQVLVLRNGCSGTFSASFSVTKVMHFVTKRERKERKEIKIKELYPYSEVSPAFWLKWFVLLYSIPYAPVSLLDYTELLFPFWCPDGSIVEE
ncbi:hypothetical protein CEXT_319531 [Caerostris extrusa]|uniref:LAGLIDADG homing endonuclease n=1 Tax=Caerostris extrusa TaxID=172846 RepID=A0AAV4ULQ0_CAEEX|nr:hypothetical protein CEXT_319531 [Caerostris extrusa]